MTSSTRLEDLQLRDFFRIVESLIGHRPPRFAFCGARPQLHKELTLIDNIFLEAPHGTIKDKSKRNYTQQNFGGNVYLHQLFERLPYPEAPAHEAGPLAQKLTALIRAIVRTDPYLFLVAPQVGMDRACMELLAKSLHLEHQLNQKTILVAGWDVKEWPLNGDIPFLEVEKSHDRPILVSIKRNLVQDKKLAA